MMIILMIRTENKGWLCYCHMLLVSKKQKMEHATLKIRVGQKYTGSVKSLLSRTVIIKHSSERHLNYVWSKTVHSDMACADKSTSC